LTTDRVRPILLAAAGAAAILLPTAAAAQGLVRTEDPLEKLNRKTFALNRVIDRYVVGPVVLVYIKVFPKPVRKAVHNVVTELGEPQVFANDMLQARPKRAARTLARLVVNATAGLGGLFDPASRVGLEHHDNGFADTLARYGVTPGPYIVLPLFGPSTFRDGIGVGMDTSWDITRYASFGHHSTAIKTTVTVLDGVDQRANAAADLQQIQNMGSDMYATLRSLYLQNREAEIRGNAPLKLEDLPDFGDADIQTSPSDVTARPASAAPEASAQPASPPAEPAPTSP
jgi:phospholipid-binding lipoprotein MlaA